MKKKNIYLMDQVKRWIFLFFICEIIITFIDLYIIFVVEKLRIIASIHLFLNIILLQYGMIYIFKKYKSIEKMMLLYLGNYLIDNLNGDIIPVNKLVDKVLELQSEKLNKSELINITKKQAQYSALQNQINPHFLYNTLESIRSEAICSGMEGVAAMTEALATFFRYTISNVDHLVTIEDELSNIENYYLIQQYRFGKKLNLRIQYEEEENSSLLNLRLPKLILQPIVENAIYHGIEKKVGKGCIIIKITRTLKRLIIKISDDGLGMENEVLESLNKKLLSYSLEGVSELKNENSHGGIAITNVNNRIKLLYGEEYGLYLYSKVGVGTDVQITLPVLDGNI